MSSTSSKLLLRETIARRMWQSVTLHELDKERSFVFILSTSFMKMSELVLGPIPQTDFVNPVFKHAHFFRNRKRGKITVLHDLILKTLKIMFLTIILSINILIDRSKKKLACGELKTCRTENPERNYFDKCFACLSQFKALFINEILKLSILRN